MATPVTHTQIHRVEDNNFFQANDLLATEEPLEINLIYGPEDRRQEQPLAVTMRTPGNDEELALGFLFTEGIISGKKDVIQIKHCETVSDEAARGNVLKIHLHPNLPFDATANQRHFYTNSSCGVCGKTSIESVYQVACYRLDPSMPQLDAALVHTLPGILRDRQALFEHTGGIHAAGIFDTSGELILLREDVGRHNALDKLIGAALYADLIPLSEYIIQVSGRGSFELVQKALMAGTPIMAAVGAPSSLAAQLAQDAGMTLLGFVRNNRFNLYTGPQRVQIAK